MGRCNVQLQVPLLPPNPSSIRTRKQSKESLFGVGISLELSEDFSRASTRKICPKWGPRKRHEKATKKPRKSHEKRPNTVFPSRWGPRKSHEKTTKKPRKNGDKKKFTKNPRPFSMQDSQATTKKLFTKCFWRAGRVKFFPQFHTLRIFWGYFYLIFEAILKDLPKIHFRTSIKDNLARLFLFCEVIFASRDSFFKSPRKIFRVVILGSTLDPKDPSVLKMLWR